MTSIRPQAKRPWVRRAMIAGLWLVLALGLTYLASAMDWASVASFARKADPLWLAAAVVANLFALPLWALSWRLLAPRKSARFFNLLEVLCMTLASVQMFSLVAGIATAVLLLVKRAGLTKAAALSVLTLDQIVTGMVKVLLIAAAIIFVDAPVWMRHAGASLLVLVLVGLGVLLVAARSEARLIAYGERKQGRVSHLITFLASWTAHLDPLRHPLRTGVAVIVALLRRLAEGVGALCIQKACGIPVSLELGLLVMTALALVTVIPQPPGNIGLYEAAVVVVYQMAGYPPETALAIALLQHVMFLIAALIPGCLVFAIRRPWRDMVPIKP
jgi:uncharacterized protein (TIRG00374 family)